MLPGNLLGFYSFTYAYDSLLKENLNWQMFTNGMSETMSSEVLLREVSPEAFKAMLKFMYNGELDMEVTMGAGALLLQLFFLADQFGVTLLHQECCKTLLECLTEVV